MQNSFVNLDVMTTPVTIVDDMKFISIQKRVSKNSHLYIRAYGLLTDLLCSNDVYMGVEIGIRPCKGNGVESTHLANQHCQM